MLLYKQMNDEALAEKKGILKENIKKEKACSCSCCSNEENDDDDDDEEEKVSLKKLILAAVIFVAALIIDKFKINFNLPTFIPEKAPYILLYFISYFLCGFTVLKEAIEGIRKGKIFGEAFLMSIATLGAVFMGEYSEAVAVMLLFQLGEFLEDKAVGASKRSIKSLMDIRPDTALVKKEGSESLVEVLAEDVPIGSIIVVRPGDRVPLDGKIVSGLSFVDTSALTGESLPRQVGEGDAVFSGFLNTNSVLEIKVEKSYGESSASRILNLVEEARNKKASTEKFISRFAKVYTPLVCLVALLLALVPPLIINYSSSQVWRAWVYRALELLVVSCPCALVISIPLSFFAGLGLASRKGILIKGSAYIEALSKTKTVVFDKTGTLTKGVFEVTGIYLEDSSISKEDLLTLAAHAEYYSDHPISRSLKKAHSCPKCGKSTLLDSKEISGHGISCVMEGKKILVGNRKLMQREGIELTTSPESGKGKTEVFVAADRHCLGCIVISDIEKEDSLTACKKLKDVGVEQVVMLTGDTEDSALECGKKLGIDRIFASLLPADKVSKVEELLLSYKDSEKKLAFVGDGINDAPVLSRSDIGIAMGAMGSDSAVEAADVVIMDDRPGKVSDAIRVSKKIMTNVWENLIFSLTVKVAIISLCSLGFANMWLAVFGDVGVTMLAVVNSMRLLLGKNKKNG